MEEAYANSLFDLIRGLRPSPGPWVPTAYSSLGWAVSITTPAPPPLVPGSRVNLERRDRVQMLSLAASGQRQRTGLQTFFGDVSPASCLCLLKDSLPILRSPCCSSSFFFPSLTCASPSTGEWRGPSRASVLSSAGAVSHTCPGSPGNVAGPLRWSAREHTGWVLLTVKAFFKNLNNILY